MVGEDFTERDADSRARPKKTFEACVGSETRDVSPRCHHRQRKCRRTADTSGQGLQLVTKTVLLLSVSLDNH